MYDRLLDNELGRLLRLIEMTATRFECSTSEAIDRLASLLELADPDAFRPRRNLIDFAEDARKIRLQRNDALGAPMFRDPAWDMLLDLLVAKDRGERLSVHKACRGAGVPTTTALRYIDRLERYGLITRTPDERDQRRVWLDLAPEAEPRIANLVASLQACA